MTLLCFSLLSRWLGPKPFGLYSLASTLVGLASTLGLLGLDMAYARYYLDSKSDDKISVESFCWSRSAGSACLFAFVSTLLWIGLSQKIGASDRIIVTISLPFIIVFSVMATMATTRVRLMAHYGRMASAVAVSSFTSALLSLSLAAFGFRGVLPLLVGAIVTSLLSLIWLGLPPLRVFFSGAVSRLSPSKQREILGLGFSCALTGPLYWLISSSDRWFLALGFGEADLGVYSISSTLALSGIMVNSAVHLALFPEASRVFDVDDSDQSFRLARLWEQLAVVLLIVMLLVGSLGGPLLRLLTPSSFHIGATYIPWLSCGVFFYGLAGLANLPFFLVGKMNRVAMCWALAACFCLILSSIVIPRFGGIGAAITQMCVYLCLSILILVSGRLLMPFPLRWIRLVFILVMGLIGLAAMSLFPLVNPWFELSRNLIASTLVGLGLARLVSPVSLSRPLTMLKLPGNP